MTRKLFTADRFIATQHSSAEEKSRFCVAYAKFILGGFPRSRFKIRVLPAAFQYLRAYRAISTRPASGKSRSPRPPSSASSFAASTSGFRWATRTSAGAT